MHHKSELLVITFVSATLTEDTCVENAVNYLRMWDKIILLAIIGFLCVFLGSAALATMQAQSILSWYAFSLMALYIIRGAAFKQPYDKAIITILFLIGTVLKMVNLYQ